MPLKGCRRKSQRAEIIFLTAVGGIKRGDKITNDNIKFQLKTVNVMVKYQKNKTSNVTIRGVCEIITATEMQ